MTLVVGLDLTCLEAALETGVERYARRLAETLPKAAPEHRYVVIVREGKPAPAVPAPGVVVAAPAFLGRALWREAVLPGVVREHGIAVLHAPVAAVAALARVPRVVTVHDVPDPRRHPGEGGLFSRHRLRLRHALSVAEAVVTPSFATREDLVAMAPDAADRVTVVPHGVDPDFRPHGPELDRARYGLPPGPYVLCVATVRPRKDHASLIRAFARLAPSREHFLVLAGKQEEDPAPLLALAAELGIGDRVRLPGYVAREDLPDLYREAAAFVLPSRLEGFGLPLLEAMASGTPVLCSDAGAIPEVAGGAALMFPAGDVERSAELLARILDRPEERDRLRRLGFARAATFSWDDCARRHAEVYARAAAAGAAPRGGE
jgi:alpha-1,3-rhamnosyl/mannosyltransferase